MTPFLKWAGGKRWLTKRLRAAMPGTYSRYVEPFLGSGAIFFDLLPSRATLSDANEELIRTYRAVRHSPTEIQARLELLHATHGKELYYEQRSLIPLDEIQRAARFIYLNRTCWNGLYRVNKKNIFNVPLGTKTSVVFPNNDLTSASQALSQCHIICQDFELTIDGCVSGDLIYVDPPYTVKHNLNGFLKYNQTMFSWSDQVRLHEALVRARDRGCHIIASNADHESIRELYSDFPALESVPRASVIAGSATARGQTSELLVVHHA